METILQEVGSWRPWSALGVLAVLLLWETAAPYFAQFRGRERLRHGGKNLALGLLNGVVIALVFAGLWVTAATWAEREGWGLLRWVELPWWAELVTAVLLFDLWTYFWHRLNHRVPFFWRFHRVHHSDPWMDVTTANRFHLGEIVFSSLLRVPVIVAIGLNAGQLAVYELAMFAVVQFHHANVGLPERWDRAMRLLVVTPAMHKVHHSRRQPETDSNYSSLFSFWDRIFRSFRLRRDPRGIQFGLHGYDGARSQSLGGMLRMPVRALRPDREDPSDGNGREKRAGRAGHVGRAGDAEGSGRE